MATKKYVSLAKLQTFLENLNNKFAAKIHTHKISDLTDYTVDTALSPDSTNPVQNKVLDAEFDAVSEAMGALDLAIDGKADATHSHAIEDVSGLQSALDGKALSSHEHDYLPLTGGSLSNATTMPLLIENTTSGDPEIRIAYMANGGVSGFLGFQGENNPTFWDNNFNAHGIYHEGNPPTYSDVGAAPSSHEHSAYKITSGILSTEYGGTGNNWGYVQAGAQEGSSIGALATAEGRETIASGSYSHAEGNYTEATGLCAHAEGQTTKAYGSMSHAEGESTEANAKRSHAEGDHTIASGENQHVQGKYNIEDEDGVYAHIVGNGDWKTRSNAHTVDWDGNGWFAGDVYVGGTSQDDGASKLISKADAEWSIVYDSGEITEAANSIVANIDFSAYNNFQLVVYNVNDGTNTTATSGTVVFTAKNGTTYLINTWPSGFFSNTSGRNACGMAHYKILNGWLMLEHAVYTPGASKNIFDETEGGTAVKCSASSGGAFMRCTNELATMAVTSQNQNTSNFFGVGSRMMIWGCKV